MQRFGVFWRVNLGLQHYTLEKPQTSALLFFSFHVSTVICIFENHFSCTNVDARIFSGHLRAASGSKLFKK